MKPSQINLMRVRDLGAMAMLAALGWAASCAHALEAPAPMEKVVDAADLGLAPVSVFDTAVPVVSSMQGEEPGSNVKMPSYFREGPPSIPHSLEDFLPITLGENACLECHEDREAVGQPVSEGDPTPLPLSHYTDLRQDSAKPGDALNGGRYVCVLCHVPQTDAKPLVRNTYR